MMARSIYKRKPARAMGVGVCGYCGGNFRKIRYGQRYCRPGCRTLAWQARHGRKKKQQLREQGSEIC